MNSLNCVCKVTFLLWSEMQVISMATWLFKFRRNDSRRTSDFSFRLSWKIHIYKNLTANIVDTVQYLEHIFTAILIAVICIIYFFIYPFLYLQDLLYCSTCHAPCTFHHSIGWSFFSLKIFLLQNEHFR